MCGLRHGWRAGHRYRPRAMIRTRQLQYAYPGGEALIFPDVDVPQGTVLLLSGPSGCGKSTWLALVAALVTPSAGELTVAGQPLGALKNIAADAWRASAIGFLPQKLHLSAALTVQQNLALVFWASGQPEDPGRIHATLEALGVNDLAQRKPGQLSGGQAQRVALARAVLLKPQVILADEPTASLDDEASARKTSSRAWSPDRWFARASCFWAGVGILAATPSGKKAGLHWNARTGCCRITTPGLAALWRPLYRSKDCLRRRLQLKPLTSQLHVRCWRQVT